MASELFRVQFDLAFDRLVSINALMRTDSFLRDSVLRQPSQRTIQPTAIFTNGITTIVRSRKNPLVSLHQVPWKHGRAGMTYLYAVPGISSSFERSQTVII